MKTGEDLRRSITGIDHKSYGMYKNLAGSYQFRNYILHFDHVQGDPFASPSRLRLELTAADHGFPREYRQSKHRKLALEDMVLRQFQKNLRSLDTGRMGSGKSGRISCCRTGQTIQERIAVLFQKDRLEIRFEMGLPARGRTILGREMTDLVFHLLPKLVTGTFVYGRWSEEAKKRLSDAIKLSDNQAFIREELERRGLTAFVADGAILPRESGISDRPMKEAIPFSSPEDLRVEISLPHGQPITGMGIPEGITVIAGGGYHGKSTLLKALEQGVYNHIRGDGREYVLTRDYAFKIRAEDGRSVNHTDISLFINHLPNGQDTRDFTTENASGSTSQAANLMEALETGSRLLLLDEDTSATNFMIRDKVMAKLVSDDKEPICTLLRRIRTLWERKGVSFILVVGSSGDYLSVADLVLQLDHYHVKNVTAAAREIIEKEGLSNQYPAGETEDLKKSRQLLPVRTGRMKCKASGTDSVIIDRDLIDVRYLEQLTEPEQTVGLTYLTAYVCSSQKEAEDFKALADRIYQKIDRDGFMALIPRNYPAGQPALPRKEEMMACLNRYRALKFNRNRQTGIPAAF